MKITPANPPDLDTIYLMGYDTWSEGRGVEQYLADCRTNPEYQQGCWRQLVTDSHTPVASLIVYDLPDIGRFRASGLGCIATAAEHRRQGHAARLIDLVLIERREDDIILLFSDIAPAYYEAFGFKALPPACQHYPKSVSMVKLQQSATLDELLQHAGQLPAYF